MLKKSNAFKFLIATFALAAFAVSTAYAAMDFGSTTLRVGSKGEYVKTLQTLVGAIADGNFGPATKAKVATWQSTCGGLTVDGVFGPMSMAKANAGCGTTVGTFPAGCSSATGYSSTTGLPCTGGSSGTYPAGCTSNTGYSTTTGQSCAGTVTTTGTNGYLSDIASDSSNRVSTVYESEQDKVVAGFRATARLSSQTITRVRVAMRNTDTAGSSMSLAKYISGASLWSGSTKLATMSVAQADRSTSDDTYTFNFSGLNAMVAQDQIGRFYVSVNVNGSLDTGDVSTPGSANWAVTFPDGGLSASSPDGTYDTYNASAGNVGTLLGSNVGFTLGKFSANGVKADVNLSASNPAATVVAISNTAATNGVTLLKFTVKATNSNLTIRKVPISVTSTTSGSTAMINTIKLMSGTNTVDSVDGAAGTGTCGSAGVCVYSFSSLTSPYNLVTSGSTAEYSVVVDLKSKTAGSYADGVTLTASLLNSDVTNSSVFSLNDVNGDQLGNSYRYGGAVGQIMTLRENGVNVVMGTPTYSTVVRGGTGAGSADIIDATYTIPLTVTSFGQTVYAGQVATAAATAPGTTGAGAVAVAYGFNKSSAPGTLTSYSAPDVNITVGSSTLSSSDATIENLAYRLDSGSAKHFTLTVNLNSIGATAGAAKSNIRVALQKFATWTDNALSAGQSIQSLLPIQSYQTGYVGITAN